jgi:hypothetical protein
MFRQIRHPRHQLLWRSKRVPATDHIASRPRMHLVSWYLQMQKAVQMRVAQCHHCKRSLWKWTLWISSNRKFATRSCRLALFPAELLRSALSLRKVGGDSRGIFTISHRQEHRATLATTVQNFHSEVPLSGKHMTACLSDLVLHEPRECRIPDLGHQLFAKRFSEVRRSRRTHP